MNLRSIYSAAAAFALAHGILVLALALAWPTGARAVGPAPDPHAHHHAQAAESSAASVPTPLDVNLKSLRLVRADGKAVDLAAELAGDNRPVLLNFIFTTCTAICPVMSQVFAEVQGGLGKDSEKVRMVSISIDPEHDTPERLAAYAKRFGAGSQWGFYTGTASASIAAQRAFSAYRGDRMNHEARTFLRQAAGGAWTRIDGLATPTLLIAQARAALATR